MPVDSLKKDFVLGSKNLTTRLDYIEVDCGTQNTLRLQKEQTIATEGMPLDDS